MRTDTMKNTLSIIAFCLMEKSDDKDYVNAKKVDISNYIKKKPDSITTIQKNIFYNGSPLLLKKLIGSNSVMYKINTKWLEDYGVRLIDAEKIKNYQSKGYFVFVDDLEKGGVREILSNAKK